jgi:hypothetical protein
VEEWELILEAQTGMVTFQAMASTGTVGPQMITVHATPASPKVGSIYLSK